MTPTSPSLLLRPWLPVVLLSVALAAGGAALLVSSDAVDTALGLVAGAATALLVCVLLAHVLVRLLARRERRARADQGALDSLEPLQAARRDSGAAGAGRAGRPRP